jgi:hypothetical protein
MKIYVEKHVCGIVKISQNKNQKSSFFFSCMKRVLFRAKNMFRAEKILFVKVAAADMLFAETIKARVMEVWLSENF